MNWSYISWNDLGTFTYHIGCVNHSNSLILPKSVTYSLFIQSIDRSNSIYFHPSDNGNAYAIADDCEGNIISHWIFIQLKIHHMYSSGHIYFRYILVALFRLQIVFTSVRKRFPDCFNHYPIISVYKKFVISKSIMINFWFVPWYISMAYIFILSVHWISSSFIKKLFPFIHNERTRCSRMHIPHSNLYRSSSSRHSEHKHKWYLFQ